MSVSLVNIATGPDLFPQFNLMYKKAFSKFPKILARTTYTTPYWGKYPPFGNAGLKPNLRSPSRKSSFKEKIMAPLVLFSFFLFLVSETIRAQDITSEKISNRVLVDKNYYQTRSENAKGAAVTLLSCGSAIAIGGALLAATTVHTGYMYTPIDVRVAAGVGAGIALASIPAFIMSAHYRHKAWQASAGLRFSHGAPGMALKINF